MKIFLKYVMKNMFEKKGRLLLLIISIAISTGLLVASVGIIDIVKNLYVAPYKAVTEGKDVAILSTTNQVFFTLDHVKEAGVKNIEGEIRTTGIINKNKDSLEYITLVGREKGQINTDYIIEGSVNQFKENDCIISKRISEEKNLKLGDTIEMLISGESKRFNIAAISKNDGLFYMDKETQFYVIVNYDYLGNLFNANGKYNYAGANITGDALEDSMKEFNDANKNYSAHKLFDEDEVTSMTGSISAGLYIMLSIVVLISILIIYGAFKLTITERLPVIGTFFSQGASHKKVEGILLVESLGYGVLGGIAGNVLGIAGLYAINYFMSPLAEYGIRESFSFNPLCLFIGFIFALLLSVISAIVPVVSIRQLSEKDVILNNTTQGLKNGWVRFMMGIACLMGGVACYVNNGQWTEDGSVVFFVVAIIGMILSYKKIIDIFTKILSKLVKGKNNILFLALNNIRTTKVLMDSVLLIMIALFASLMIAAIGQSLIGVVSEAYTELSYDISISNIITDGTSESTTERIIDQLKETDGVDVDSINPVIMVSGYINKKSMFAIGVLPEIFGSYMKYLNLDSDTNRLVYKEFTESKGKTAIITNALLKSIKMKVGDMITLKVNDIEDEYKIIGSIDGKLFMNGQYVLIHSDQLAESYHVNEAAMITLRTATNVHEVKEKISTIATQFGATCVLREKDLENNLEQNKQIVQILGVFSYMAIVISAIGVLNNIIIVFLQRKRDFAVLSSVGMNSQTRVKLLIYESILVVFWSCVITILCSFILMGNLTKVMTFAGLPMTVTLDFNTLPIYCLGTMIIVLIATIPVIAKSKKISIIQELKYE